MRIGLQIAGRGVDDTEPPARRSAAILPGKTEQAIAFMRPTQRIGGKIHSICELLLSAGLHVEQDQPVPARNRRLQPVRIKRKRSGNGKRGECSPSGERRRSA